MWNVGLVEAQAGKKIAERNINNLRYADDTTLMAESEEVSSAYLRLLVFLLAIFILACASSSLAFHIMHSAYVLNKQSEHISFDIFLFQFGTSLLFHV